MGEIREGLGEMADPADLVTALVQLGLLKRAFTGTELAAETGRAGGAELFRLEMAHALAGAADMQILMAAGAAADAGAEPARIMRATDFAYTGANCEKEDDAKFTLVRVQAQRLSTQLMVMAADFRAGRAELPLMVYPAMLVAGALEKMLNVTTLDDPAARAAALAEAAGELTGGAEVIQELADKNAAYAARP
jgi:hypothetical protein